MAGVGIRTIQELGGWKEIKMVERYAHFPQKHKGGFEAGEALTDHVIRDLLRNDELFARVNPGDQYPEVWRQLNDMLAERIVGKLGSIADLVQGGLRQLCNRCETTVILK